MMSVLRAKWSAFRLAVTGGWRFYRLAMEHTKQIDLIETRFSLAQDKIREHGRQLNSAAHVLRGLGEDGKRRDDQLLECLQKIEALENARGKYIQPQTGPWGPS